MQVRPRGAAALALGFGDDVEEDVVAAAAHPVREGAAGTAVAGGEGAEGLLVGPGPPDAEDLPHPRRQRPLDHVVLDREVAAGGRRHRLAEGDQRRVLERVPGRLQVGRGHPLLPPGAELAVAAGDVAARQAEQLAEPDVVLPERLALGFGERPHHRLVHLPAGVGDHRQRPQHQLRVEGRVGAAGGVGADGLGQLALDPFVQAVDLGQHRVGFLAGAEEDRLLDLGGAGEALERAGRRPAC